MRFVTRFTSSLFQLDSDDDHLNSLELNIEFESNPDSNLAPFSLFALELNWVIIIYITMSLNEKSLIKNNKNCQQFASVYASCCCAPPHCVQCKQMARDDDDDLNWNQSMYRSIDR